jgi:hypothetical protein
LIWNVAELITLCVNKKGIHPGAHIALDFLLFAGLLPSGVLDVGVLFYGGIFYGAGAMEILASYVQANSFPIEERICEQDCSESGNEGLTEHATLGSSTSSSSSSPASQSTIGGKP